MPTVISVENLSKTYRLGQIGTGTFTNDLKLWWAKARNKPNPLLKIGESDHGNRDGEDLWALRDVSFTVEQGEVLGIIGRNGAGKSTLLKILSRVTAPTSGKVKVKGRIASLLEVGTGFHPELTGRENIYLNGAILGMKRDEIARKFDEIVDFAEVEKFIDTPVKRYSSGMYVRLAFAVAAHLEPEILVVDEVLAVGDAEFQKKCLGKMGKFAQGGRTVLFVSHNMGAVRNLCQRVIWLQSGVIQEQGNSHDMIEHYLAGNRSKSTRFIFPTDNRKPMCLREVALFDMQDKPTCQLSMNHPFYVTIKYDINQVVKGAHVICFITTNDGVNVIGTGDADTNSDRLGTRLPGQYVGKFNIPASLLGEGHYSITVSLGIPFVQVYDRHENILGFEVIDLESTRRALQHQRRPGILGLEIPWVYEIDPIGEFTQDRENANVL